MQPQKQGQNRPKGGPSRNAKHIRRNQGVLKKTLVGRTGGSKGGTYQGGSQEARDPNPEKD